MGAVLLDALERAAGRGGSLTFASGGDHSTVSWADLHGEARGLAGSLQARGLGRGSAVGLLGSTTRPLVTGIQAVWLSGASVTVVNPPLSLEADVIAGACVAAARAARLDALLVCPPFDPVTAALEPALAAVGCDVIGLGDEDLAAATAGDAPYTRPGLTPDDTALRQFTSGSTSEPRAVRITHGNLTANLAGIITVSQHHGNGDVMLSWLPLFHDMGLIGYLTLPMSCGHCQLILSSPEDFLARPMSWMENISRFRAATTAAPSFAYGLLARLLRVGGADLDLSSLRFALSGGEPIDPDVIEAFIAAGAPYGLRPDVIVPAFGLAESTLAVSMPPAHRGLRTDDLDADALAGGRVIAAGPGAVARRLPLLGAPLPGLEVRVIDVDSGVERGEREIGELWIRGSSVSPGYVGDDDGSGDREAGAGGGWLATGDLGYLTDGEVVVCGRRKEIVIVAGRNILPHDVERAVATVPGVRAGRVAAFRGPDRPGAESLVVAVESKDPAAVRLAAVSAAVVATVGVRPREVLVLAPGTLPKTTSGKMRRAEIRRRYLAGELAPPPRGGAEDGPAGPVRRPAGTPAR